jgi:hypothetical protein
VPKLTGVGRADAEVKTKAQARPGLSRAKLGKIGAAALAVYLVVRHLNPVKVGRLARNAVAVYALAPRPGLAGLRRLAAAAVVLFAVIRRKSRSAGRGYS